MEDKYILAIESSCDETSAAVVVNGREMLSNVIASQIDTHKKYGGVVPEVASRMHIEAISGVVEEALKEANVTSAFCNASSTTPLTTSICILDATSGTTPPNFL